MLAMKVACPSCSTPLRSAQPLPVGKRVRCPRCGLPFTVCCDPAPTNGFHSSSPTSAFPAAPAFAVPPEPSGEAPPNRVLLLGLIFGGIVLLAGASIGLALMFSGSTSSPQKDDRRTETDDSARDRDRRTFDDSDPRSDRYVPPPDSRKDDKKDDPRDQMALRIELPKEEQAKVDAALEKGVAQLKRSQLASGSWKPDDDKKGNRGYHPVGCAALPALTLLECGVKPDDPCVQKAAKYVRDRVATINQTYEIALSILFLDRLGEAEDKERIQALGVRLIAGQLPSGGWSYLCSVRSNQDTKDVLLVLEKTRPATSRELHLDISSSSDSKPIIESSAKEQLEKAVKELPKELQKVPALQAPEDDLKPFRTSDSSSDNSNTQFGLLGVWVAGRHGVPTERSLALVARRFRARQTKKGSWGYYWRPALAEKETTPSMTAAGLLGLAVGHGLSTGEQKNDTARKKVDDPAIKKGLQALGEHIGKPLGSGRKANARGKTLADINLYFLWSVERVAVLYNLPKINDKDWYAWGAELLVDHQEKDGSWKVGGYPGVNETHTALVDTCFALLFLKRANLVKDLTSKVEFVIDSK
jgi:hypothetical protein